MIGIKREYLSYRHFSRRMNVLGSKQFLKQGYPEAIVKVVIFGFCLLFAFSRFSSTLKGGRGGGGHLPQNCPNTFDQDCRSITNEGKDIGL